MSLTAQKIRSVAQSVAWRRAVAGPVVFTNGVFDLVHPGHVQVLEEARSLGSVLIVGINSDASAQRLNKGSGRPINTALARARVVAAFHAVDCVVVFPEDTPEAVIRALQPEILVKGDDYAPDALPGREIVVARGGHVHLVARDREHSTSSLIRRIRAAT